MTLTTYKAGVNRHFFFILASAFLLLGLPLSLCEYPSPPYAAVWNSPTIHCPGQQLDLSPFHIMQNQGDAINGGNITVMKNLGLFPSIGTPNTTLVNGGIPQKGNLTLHLEKVKRDLEAAVPDSNFTGLGVIMFQAWKPLFRQNFDALGSYQVKSVSYARSKHPDWSDEKLTALATTEFNDAARKFLEETLNYATSLRPNGRWGYLGFPYCNGILGYYCDDMSKQENDAIQWLWDASTALYPNSYYSVYREGDDVIDLVSVIHESHRIMAARAEGKKPLYLYLYTRYTYYDEPQTFYRKGEIEESTTFPNLFGVDAIVVYGTGEHTNSPAHCSALRTFLTSTYGPSAKAQYEWAVDCSNGQCSGHGQCVDISEGQPNQFLKVLPKVQSTSQPRNPALYVCRCYHGWKGEDCSQKRFNKLHDCSV